MPKAQSSKSKATILIGVTASIAAYKAADLVSKLKKAGHDMHVVMTHDATHFVTPLTLRTLSGHEVVLNLFDENPETHVTHVNLADRADLLVIAPATADILAKLAYGFADNALAAIALVTRCPILIAPAMNGKMYLHSATQQNVATLKARGVHFIGPEKGMLACGYEGVGRLWNVDAIVEEVEKLLQRPRRPKQ